MRKRKLKFYCTHNHDRQIHTNKTNTQNKHNQHKNDLKFMVQTSRNWLEREQRLNSLDTESRARFEGMKAELMLTQLAYNGHSFLKEL